MGPDFHGGQKTTKKFPTKVTKKGQKISNLTWTHKKIQKGFSNTVSQKKFSTKVAKK